MSSLPRRMQIRGMKQLGFRRTKFRIAKDIDGREVPVRVTRGGLILNPNGDRIGYHWPRSVSA